jgi:rhodanese-related sulfurtransferase
MPHRITPEELIRLVGTEEAPIIVDVRREPALRASGRRIAGSDWRDHLASGHWLAEYPSGSTFVVYCAHGHNVSALAASAMAAAGADVAILAGGFEAYLQAGGPTVRIDPPGAADLSGKTAWITRERPKIDRIACPWLIRRFFDRRAVFHFVPAEWVADVAAEMGAIPFDVDGVVYSHRGANCSFDTMIEEFGLANGALDHLARIVRAADTSCLDMEPQAHGLLAISLGLSALEPDDWRQLERGMVLYDSLYGWCRHATAETHNWPAGIVPR